MSKLSDRIEPFLSSKKISPYKTKYADNWFTIYKAEIEQAKEAFVYLHFLEIFLRNKIAIELNKDFGDWLFNKQSALKLNYKEQKKIAEVLLSLGKMGKEINQDNIISNLNFGFWTNIFHKSYNYSIWQQNKILIRLFPHLKSSQRNLSQIQKEMEKIRKFRNRIFHFENLQNLNIEQMKNLINKFIYGISKIKMLDILNEN
jgi:hypothetical protein